MKYIQSKPGHIDFDTYRAYLETVRGQLPAHVFAFASSSEHFDLQSRSSLHDAWLEALLVRETGSGNQRVNRSIEIQLTFLGAFHDRWIRLSYTGVAEYSFSKPSCNGANDCGSHGDLFTHEIRLGREGLIIHELLFERDARLLIECADLNHSVELIQCA